MSVVIQFTASVHYSKWERRFVSDSHDSTNDVGGGIKMKPIPRER